MGAAFAAGEVSLAHVAAIAAVVEADPARGAQLRAAEPELLQVAPNSLLLRVQSISYAQNRAIVDFSEIYQNTSKYNVKHITRR